MALHFFRISIMDSTQQQEALNQFIANNAVLDVEKQLVADGQKSYWAVCVTTALNAKVIFTNAQLADMVTHKVATKTALAAIEGIGEARVEKHADTFIKCLRSKLSHAREVVD